MVSLKVLMKHVSQTKIQVFEISTRMGLHPDLRNILIQGHIKSSILSTNNVWSIDFSKEF